ncbi:MAG TPA: gas vesicle protein GvpG [Longimicrobiaceae bacterium]|nr:gas vesicle protein GvpG [Longimicrobiaceae bacterium]
MGLLKHLLFWPVTGPQFLVEFSLGKVEETVRKELTDDQSVKEDLLALQMQLELGEIDDAEYLEREAELMRRFREVREWREEFGMGTTGGPVRVAGSGTEGGEPTEPPGEGEPDPERQRGGIASSGGASVEFDLGWDER